VTNPLYKTIVVIWTEYNPVHYKLDELGYDATDGEAYCSKRMAFKIEDPALDPDWDDTKFFEEDELLSQPVPTLEERQKQAWGNAMEHLTRHLE
jgi:hypothetical protein